MSRAAAVGLGALRLAVAAALIAATSYVLGWRILYDGLHGSDCLFHLNLASWVASTFPAIGWWYPWDGNGVPYREGYPLVAHWLTVAAARLTTAGGRHYRNQPWGRRSRRSSGIVGPSPYQRCPISIRLC